MYGQDEGGGAPSNLNAPNKPFLTLILTQPCWHSIISPRSIMSILYGPRILYVPIYYNCFVEIYPMRRGGPSHGKCAPCYLHFLLGHHGTPLAGHLPHLMSPPRGALGR
jgi:hypothetical protein